MRTFNFSHLKMLLLLVASITFSNAFSQITIINKSVDFGWKPAENRDIDAIILHSTFNNSGGEKYDIDLVIKQFSQYKVSAHYVIGRAGAIYQLVNENNISYHAGKSQLPDGRTAVNTCSIGIELMTSFDETPTAEQLIALSHLVADIKTRYKINYILRHSDIAPGRKTDPWNMDWEAFILSLEE